MPFWQLKCCSTTVRGPQVHAAPTEKCNECLAEVNFAKALTSFCISSEVCPSSVFSSNHK